MTARFWNLVLSPTMVGGCGLGGCDNRPPVGRGGGRWSTVRCSVKPLKRSRMSFPGAPTASGGPKQLHVDEGGPKHLAVCGDLDAESPQSTTGRPSGWWCPFAEGGGVLVHGQALRRPNPDCPLLRLPIRIRLNFSGEASQIHPTGFI